MCDSSSGGASCGPVAWAHDKDSLRWMIAAIQMSSEVVLHLETTILMGRSPSRAGGGGLFSPR